MQKKLTIHFFVQTVHKQGTFFRVHNLALGLKNAGHTVKVFGASYDKGDKNRVERIDDIEYNITACYFPLQQFFGQYTHPMAAVKRLLQKYPPCDVAHVFQPSISAYLPWRSNRKKAIQNVYDWDDLWTDGLIKKANGFLAKWMYRQVDYIERKGPKISDYTVTCSNFLLKKAADFGAAKTEIIYNGYWLYTPKTKEASRRLLKLDPNTFYIGFMGRTLDDVEADWCFNLLRKASDQFSGVRLALCGMPENSLNKIDPDLRSKIDYLGFLEPMVTRDFASAIDIGLLPLDDTTFNQSRFPIKFAEYLAAGAPVLCTRVGECSHIAMGFPFVKITEPTNDSWVKEGTDMIDKIIKNVWPVVDKEKISAVLAWEHISERLENIYLTNNPIAKNAS